MELFKKYWFLILVAGVIGWIIFDKLKNKTSDSKISDIVSEEPIITDEVKQEAIPSTFEKLGSSEVVADYEGSPLSPIEYLYNGENIKLVNKDRDIEVNVAKDFIVKDQVSADEVTNALCLLNSAKEGAKKGEFKMANRAYNDLLKRLTKGGFSFVLNSCNAKINSMNMNGFNSLSRFGVKPSIINEMSPMIMS